MGELNIGDVAPDFDLEGNGGNRVSLSALKGKPVVVYFYPKDDTPGCTKEAIAFTDLIDNFSEIGATIIGLSPDAATKHDKFVAKHNLAVRLGADTDTGTAQAYGVWGREKHVWQEIHGRRTIHVSCER